MKPSKQLHREYVSDFHILLSLDFFNSDNFLNQEVLFDKPVDITVRLGFCLKQKGSNHTERILVKID